MKKLPENADVWVLAGQSNMAGSGIYEPYEEPDENVWLYSLKNEWKTACEPFSIDRYQSVEYAFAIMRGEKNIPGKITSEYIKKRIDEYPQEILKINGGAGLGLTLGKALFQYTKRPVGLVFCAKGDTRMEEWDPDYQGDDYMALYQSTIRRIKSIGRKITGIIWYQGESDTFDGKGFLYQERMKKLVSRFRRDLDRPDLPFFYVQIGNCFSQSDGELPEWNLVQDIQRSIEKELAPGGMCPAIDLPLSDGIHLSTSSQKRLGRRLAKIIRRNLYHDNTYETGPRLHKIERDPERPGVLKLRFSSVNGRLFPEDHIAGFSVFASDCTANKVCRAGISPDNHSVVEVWTYSPLPESVTIWYGKGTNAYCNLTDAADLAAPVFGPISFMANYQ